LHDELARNPNVFCLVNIVNHGNTIELSQCSQEFGAVLWQKKGQRSKPSQTKSWFCLFVCVFVASVRRQLMCVRNRSISPRPWKRHHHFISIPDSLSQEQQEVTQVLIHQPKLCSNRSEGEWFSFIG
jgi:hypothetical protein